MYEKCLFVLLFILLYYAVSCIDIKNKANKYKKKNNLNVSTKEYFFKDFFQKINFLNSKDAFLSKQGYPLNLNVYSYYFVKILLATVFFFAGTKNYESSIIGAILGSFRILFH